MKKQYFLIIMLLALSLCACSGSKRETIFLDQGVILGVTGKTQMTVPVKSIDLSETQIENFVDLINSLGLIKSGVKYKKKGWQYAFSVIQEESTTSIVFADGKIVVDGYVCKPSKTVTYNIGVFFE